MLIIEDLKSKRKSWISRRRRRTWQARPGLVIMKFGEQLLSSVIREYQWYYIDYDGLKDDLKSATGPITTAATSAVDAKGKALAAPAASRREWTEDDEGRFVSKLEAELHKVHTKQQIKALEVARRITVSEREVKSVVDRLNQRGPGDDGPSEEEFMLLEEDLSDIIADVHDLAKFVQLNYTGFYKIIKKHDVSSTPIWIALTAYPSGLEERADSKTETDRLASSTCVRHAPQGQAILQGKL